MKNGCWLTLVFGLLAGLVRADEPDGFRILTGARFEAVEADQPNRPAWLFSTARGLALSQDGTREWVIYELVLDRRLGFHHLLGECIVDPTVTELYVRLLDSRRSAVVADVFGNVAARAQGSSVIHLDIQLTDQAEAVIVQVLIPSDQEEAVRMLSFIPASYEILMKTAGDVIQARYAWIRTPIYEPKNLALLSDLVLLDEGRVGDMTSPVDVFSAYGVDARRATDFDFIPDTGDGYVHAATMFVLQAIPALARFDLQFRHFDPFEPIEVWINGARVGSMSLACPDLEDAAYWPASTASSDAWRIGRWTRGWFFIDHDWLHLGENTLMIRQASDAAVEHSSLEVHGAALQFKYPWDEIATYNLLRFRDPLNSACVVKGIDRAPHEVTGQEEELFIVRADDAFVAVGAESVRPDWLRSVDRRVTKDRVDFVIGLNGDHIPHQLGVDVIYMSGRSAHVSVSLARGDEIIVDDLLEGVRLVGPYAQMSRQMMIPLRAHADVDTVYVTIRPDGGRWPRLSRLQLRAAWPAAVLAAGHFESTGELADTLYDVRSAFIAAEMLVPDRVGEVADAEVVRRVPLSQEGQWYGAETSMLETNVVYMGDARDLYFSEYEVHVEQSPQLARIDLLLQHVNVVEGTEIRVNGHLAGRVALHLPGLQDANYMIFRVNRLADDGTTLTQAEEYAVDYGPVARASLVFDGRLLQPGLNRIAIGKTPRLKGTNDHYSMKDIRLQMKFPWRKDVWGSPPSTGLHR